MKAGDRNVYICTRTYQEAQSVAARLKMPSFVYIGGVTMIVTRSTAEMRGQVLMLAANWRMRNDCMNIIREAQYKHMEILVLDDLSTASVRRSKAPEPFVVNHHDEGAVIKGNGFSFGLGVDKDEAERFAIWLNTNMPHWSKLIPPGELIDPPTEG